MDIVIIGNGNTATVLGKKLKQSGHKLLQVVGRNTEAVEHLATELGANATTSVNSLVRNAGLYIIAVPDKSISTVAASLPPLQGIVVHTAAAVTINVFPDRILKHGVLYPLQSLKKELPYLPEIPIIIDASNEETLKVLRQLALSISSSVVVAGDEERTKIHLAAVMVNNFTNYLLTVTEKFCRDEKLDFSLLIPLIRETFIRLDHLSPAAAQTGPAIRNDGETIQKHLQLLSQYPQMQKIYQLFTESLSNEK